MCKIKLAIRGGQSELVRRIYEYGLTKDVKDEEERGSGLTYAKDAYFEYLKKVKNAEDFIEWLNDKVYVWDAEWVSFPAYAYPHSFIKIPRELFVLDYRDFFNKNS